MMDCAEIAVALLAAGEARRFGSDKLLAEIEGKPLGLQSARAVARLHFGWHFAVCRERSALNAQYALAGFEILINENPQAGQARSLHLAVAAAMATPAKALLILLADMPFVTTEHILALVRTSDGAIMASNHGGTNMPPVIFPRNSWPKLLATSGDRGARALLDGAPFVTATTFELRDIDTRSDLLASK
ncbi:MAG: nucleotidyltransferase family protein [Sphingorhabdus sp.]